MESIAERQESSEDNLEFYLLTSLVAQMVKNPPARWETWIQSPGLGRSLGGGHGNPLQYSCLENPHGQMSLVGCSPWGHQRTGHVSTAHIGRWCFPISSYINQFWILFQSLWKIYCRNSRFCYVSLKNIDFFKKSISGACMIQRWFSSLDRV